VKKVVLLTGAGISAESGITTFRDSDGLWNNHNVEDVATPQGWNKNRALVLKFYNDRWEDMKKAEPNAAHKAITQLQEKYEVNVITQNIDDLHERAGNSNVLHLHGEIVKKRSSVDRNLIYPWTDRCIEIGDKCEKGSQIRPHIVWFGEDVVMLPVAKSIVKEADILIVCGTSLAVYPAAGLINFTKSDCVKYVVDPNIPLTGLDFIDYEELASTGLPKLVNTLLKQA